MDKGFVREMQQEADHTEKLVVVRNDIRGWTDEGIPIPMPPPISGGADGIFYRDSRQPFLLADQAAITLSTTDLNLFPAVLTLLPANYWWVGKTIKLTLWGKTTSDGTAGNVVFGAGIGAANPPTNINKSTAVAGTVSKTNFSIRIEAYFTCRSVGTAGSCMAMGLVQTDPAGLLLSTLSPAMIPQSAATAITLDTTLATQSPTLTMNRSGAGVWTATTQMLFCEALN
jgi:hypothetical protein